MKERKRIKKKRGSRKCLTHPSGIKILFQTTNFLTVKDF